jgi:hypothetical protein
MLLRLYSVTASPYKDLIKIWLYKPKTLITYESINQRPYEPMTQEPKHKRHIREESQVLRAIPKTADSSKPSLKSNLLPLHPVTCASPPEPQTLKTFSSIYSSLGNRTFLSAELWTLNTKTYKRGITSSKSHSSNRRILQALYKGQSLANPSCYLCGSSPIPIHLTINTLLYIPLL